MDKFRPTPLADFVEQPVHQKRGRKRKYATDKERRHAAYIRLKRKAAGLPPEPPMDPQPDQSVPELPTGKFDLAAYIAELDEVIAFARNTLNPASYARAVELKAKAMGLLDAPAGAGSGFRLIIAGLEDTKEVIPGEAPTYAEQAAERVE